MPSKIPEEHLRVLWSDHGHFPKGKDLPLKEVQEKVQDLVEKSPLRQVFDEAIGAQFFENCWGQNYAVRIILALQEEHEENVAFVILAKEEAYDRRRDQEGEGTEEG